MRWPGIPRAIDAGAVERALAGPAAPPDGARAAFEPPGLGALAPARGWVPSQPRGPFGSGDGRVYHAAEIRGHKAAWPLRGRCSGTVS